MSRFELNSSVKQPFRGESLLENQKINWEGLRKTGNTEIRKSGNPDHPEIGKSEINQEPKAIPKIRDSCIRLGLLFDVETRKR